MLRMRTKVPPIFYLYLIAILAMGMLAASHIGQA
jgi:hypothetical protein